MSFEKALQFFWILNIGTCAENGVRGVFSIQVRGFCRFYSITCAAFFMRCFFLSRHPGRFGFAGRRRCELVGQIFLELNVNISTFVCS